MLLKFQAADEKTENKFRGLLFLPHLVVITSQAPTGTTRLAVVTAFGDYAIALKPFFVNFLVSYPLGKLRPRPRASPDCKPPPSLL